ESPVARVARGRQQLDHASARLVPDVHRALEQRRRQLDQMDARLVSDMHRGLERRRQRLTAVVGRLDSLSPLGVLGRGYSVTRLRGGEIVKTSRQAPVGARVEVLLGEGSLGCRVEESKERDDRPQI